MRNADTVALIKHNLQKADDSIIQAVACSIFSSTSARLIALTTPYSTPHSPFCSPKSSAVRNTPASFPSLIVSLLKQRREQLEREYKAQGMTPAAIKKQLINPDKYPPPFFFVPEEAHWSKIRHLKKNVGTGLCTLDLFSNETKKLAAGKCSNVISLAEIRCKKADAASETERKNILRTFIDHANKMKW